MEQHKFQLKARPVWTRADGLQLSLIFQTFLSLPREAWGGGPHFDHGYPRLPRRWRRQGRSEHKKNPPFATGAKSREKSEGYTDSLIKDVLEFTHLKPIRPRP
jgi:hypothetical protein